MKSSKPSIESNSSGENQKSHQSIFIGIILAIIIGIFIGGWLPNFAVRLTILGEIFLNSLMMIVIPLVVFSMIVGIILSKKCAL